MQEGLPVVIEAAINGGRSRDEHPAVPYTPAEIAREAAAAARAGAQVVHLHARGPAGEWSAAAPDYAECLRRVRAAAPDALVSITSIRPDGTPVAAVLDLLVDLSADPSTRPDMVSVNLGHIAVWEPSPTAGRRRRTRHFPNAYEDVAATLDSLGRLGVVPELGLMDLGFVSNAVALQADGALPSTPWFLLELDSPGWGAGAQVAPSTVGNFDHLAAAIGGLFPGAAFAAHGNGVPGYAVVERALATGRHIRVGLEDAVELPGRQPISGNADLVRWAVAVAGRHGRPLASPAETRAIVGLNVGG